VPLLAQERLIGVLALYSPVALPPETSELLSLIAEPIAHRIARLEADQRIADQAHLLDKANDAIMVTDLIGQAIYWNKSAERLFGITANEALGSRIEPFLFQKMTDGEAARKATMAHGEWSGEHTCQLKSGSSLSLESRWTLVRDDSGQPKSILIVSTDISQRKRLEAQFLRGQRMESLGTLAGGIAHDLNNILSPIVMSIQMLSSKVKDPNAARMLSIVESSAYRGAQMVKQILTFARGVDGERALLQPRLLIREVVKMLKETLPKKIQVRTKIAENVCTIMGDSTQLHQVLMNLAVNARDAMPEGGVLTISVENTMVDEDQRQVHRDAKAGPHVIVCVADTGTGIPREILDNIFDPFFTTKKPGEGTGLGLATVLGIVKSHGGFIQVISEVGHGTQFRVFLPALENTVGGQGAEAPVLAPPGRGELILVVDDEASVLCMAKEILETHGYQVLTAKDGTEAVAVFSSHRGAIKGLFADMLMPNLDGPGTIKVLKKLEPGLKVIAASGLMDGKNIRETTGYADIEFLAKPFSAEKLLSTIHQVLSE
jgi:PAS domain S-box-containing protein